MNPILLSKMFSTLSSEAVRPRVLPVLIVLLLGALTFGLSSCATARGFGQDVERTGEKIEEAVTR